MTHTLTHRQLPTTLPSPPLPLPTALDPCLTPKCKLCRPSYRCACRALLLNEEGTLMVSGSSDHTIKLWDLGQQRCVQTLAVHTDSVWTLLASPDFSVIYSGGRDRCVYRSATNQSFPCYLTYNQVCQLASFSVLIETFNELGLALSFQSSVCLKHPYTIYQFIGCAMLDNDKGMLRYCMSARCYAPIAFTTCSRDA